MKTFLSIILLSLAITAFGQADSGFTNKAEAKNLKVNGMKTGKWLEYLANDKKMVKDTVRHPFRFFRLAVYDAAGNLNGIVRTYNKNGTLHSQTKYVNNQKDGVERFYDSGQVVLEVTFVNGQKTGNETYYEKNGLKKLEIAYFNGRKNGVEKVYYKSGKLMTEVPYTNNKENGVQNVYYEDGKLKQEVILVNDRARSVRNYGENGSEIK